MNVIMESKAKMIYKKTVARATFTAVNIGTGVGVIKKRN
jgi:hypothetical protein